MTACLVQEALPKKKSAKTSEYHKTYRETMQPLCAVLAVASLFSSHLCAHLPENKESVHFIGSGAVPDINNGHIDETNVKYTVTEKGVRAEEKREIIGAHNTFRKIIGQGAGNMMVVVWDDDIARVAQTHAENCGYHHDTLSERWTKSLPGVYIGQNMCAGHKSWTQCITGWYNEKDQYVYGAGTQTLSWHDIGHYTQLAFWKVSRIGCGFARCQGRKDEANYVCNYAYGQLYDDLIYPYKNDTACADCPDKCTDGLCDCGGKICQNFGEMNLNTCQCQCLPFYTGESCEISTCDLPEHESCASHSIHECQEGVNINALCPRFCGKCPA